MLDLSIRPAGERTSDLEATAEYFWFDMRGRLCAFGNREGDVRRIFMIGVGEYRFSPSSRVVSAVPNADTSPELVKDTFWRTVAPMALQALGGVEVLHASAVLGTHAGLVALCAISETGKSTLAYGLSRREYRLWADDAVAFTTQGDTIGAMQLPFHMRLRASSADHFGLPCHSEQRVLIEPGEASFWSVVPLAAVFVLNKNDSNPQSPIVDVERLYGTAAFSHVLPHAYCFDLKDVERKRQMVHRYLALVRSVPVFAVEFRTGIDHIETVLDAIEHRVLELNSAHLTA